MRELDEILGREKDEPRGPFATKEKSGEEMARAAEVPDKTGPQRFTEGFATIERITPKKASEIFGDKAIDPEKDVIEIRADNGARLVLNIPPGAIYRDGGWHIFDEFRYGRSVSHENSKFGAFSRRYHFLPREGLTVMTAKNKHGFLTIAI